MNSQSLFRVAGVGFSVLCLTNPNLMRVAAASPGPGDDEEEPLILKGVRGGSGGDLFLSRKEIRISDCVLDTLHVVACERLTLTDSILRGNVTLNASQSLTVQNCEFHHSVTYDARQGSARFTQNVFTVPLTVDSSGTNFPPPTITQNSFIGPFQAVDTKAGRLPLPDNYWNSSDGPQYPGKPPGGWLEAKGSHCECVDPKERFLLSGFERAAGQIGDIYRPHPWVWVVEARAGQNVLGESVHGRSEVRARPGKPLLVCFDLRVSRSEYTPHFALLCDGSPLPAEGGDSFTVRRFYPPVAEGAENHVRTLNFVVPANRVTGADLELKLEMDARDIGGFAGKGEKKVIWEATLKLKPGFKRKLRVGVAAVDLKIPFWITGKGVPDAARSQLQEDLEALWPLSPEDYDIVPLPPLLITRGYLGGAWQAATGGIWLTTALTRSATSYLETWNACRPPERWLDRLVCVLPGNALDTVVQAVAGGHNEGAFQNLYGLYDTVCFVDEYNARAAVHELGHAIGLNRGSDEQYDYWFFDKHGNRVDKGDGAYLRNVALFNPLRRSLNGTAAIIHHVGNFPGNGSRIYDFMGAKEPQWVIPSSLEEVYRNLYGLIGALPAGGANLAGATTGASGPTGSSLMGPPPAGYRRVLFTGVLRRYYDRDTLAYRYRLYADRVRARDVSLEGFNLTEGNRVTLQSLECFDADGEPVAPRIPILARFPDPTASPPDPTWLQVVDIPLATARLAVTDQELQGFEFLSLADDGVPFQPQLTATPSGGTLAASITLNFGHSAGAKGIPVFYQAYYSADARNTWVPIGEMTTESAITLEARDLPATGDLVFRLVAADAFRSAETQLGGFRVDNRAPVVRIESPQPEDAAGMETAWFLAAEAFDLEDGLVRTGEWRSSRDGVLGTEAVLPEARLSAGEHILTFTATDSQGTRGSASVPVRSGPVTGVDLEVGEDALRIGVSGVDPTLALPNRLQTDRVNLIRVAVRNGGLTNGATLSLYLGLENAPEQLLATRVLTDWAPFAFGAIEAACLHPGASRYTLHVVVGEALLPDPNLANNDRTWSFTNLPPVAHPARFDVTPQGPLDLVLSGFDPDGDPLAFRLVGGPTHGVIERLGDTWRYGPLNAGQDRLTFTVNDGQFESEPAAVTFFNQTSTAPVPVPPSIVSADRVFAVAGEDFAHAVVVTAPPAVFAAFGLPAGLGIDPGTGVISGRPMQPGEFNVFLEASKGGATSMQELRLRVQDTFARWAAGFGLTGADAAPEADPERDGLTNLQEYAHQLNPTTRDTQGWPKGSFLREAVGVFREVDYFTVTYRQRRGGAGHPAVNYVVDGVRYRLEYVEAVNDALSWASGGDLFEVLESRRVDNGDGTEWITVRCQIPVTDNPAAQGYVRLRLSLP